MSFNEAGHSSKGRYVGREGGVVAALAVCAAVIYCFISACLQSRADSTQNGTVCWPTDVRSNDIQILVQQTSEICCSNRLLFGTQYITAG